MRNFDECAELRTIMNDGMLFFESLKNELGGNEESIVLILGKSRFLKLVSNCVNKNNKEQMTVDVLRNKISDLQEEIRNAVTKSLLSARVHSVL